MGCASCSVTKNGVPQGCGNKGHCSSGSCNKKNTYDWLTTLDLQDPMAYGIVEISFKKGNRKSFYFNPDYTNAITGDMVVVESSNGYDVGRISLSGDLVRMQMKKVKFDESKVIHKVTRIANRRDLEKLEEARASEKKALIKARQITRTLDVDMKVGDVEYQGDKRKATFYYTADGRVDFRELVRMFAKEFRVKIEMKQIGSRQESSLIGGIGTCGRELCCSTWKSDFQTVTTVAARYQNLAINQTKLTGQCGRLKCCLNYELDTYIDALRDFPKHADVLNITNGRATLVKTDIFKGIMYYAVQKDNIRGPLVALTKEKVKKIQALNKKGVAIDNISSFQEIVVPKEEDIELEFADVTGEIELPELKRRKKRKSNNRHGNKSRRPGGDRRGPKNKSGGPSRKKEGDNKNKPEGGKPASDKDKQGNRPPRNKKNKSRPQSDNKGPNRGPAKGNDNRKKDNKGPENRNSNKKRPSNNPQKRSDKDKEWDTRGSNKKDKPNDKKD